MRVYIDFDGVICDTISTITNLYNSDYRDNVKSEDVRTWDFEELKKADRGNINLYFDDPRFFDNIVLMEKSLETITKIKYSKTIITIGTQKNLSMKKQWIDNHIDADFIGVSIDKSIVDMSDGIFIDDSFLNLLNSSAKHKICFGKEYPWNCYNIYTRCRDWNEVWSEIKCI